MEHNEQHSALLGLAIIVYTDDHVLYALKALGHFSDPTPWYKYYTVQKKSEGINIEIVDKTLYITIEMPRT